MFAGMCLTLWQLCGDSASVSTARLMQIHFDEKTQENPHHQQYQQKHDLMMVVMIVMILALNVNKVCQQ